MDPIVVTQGLNLVFGVTTLAVLALGLAVIFGLLGVLNLAHGEFIMIGAYCGWVVAAAGLPYLAAVPLVVAVCLGLGLGVERLLIRPLYRRPFDTLVATWGLSLLLRKAAEAAFGLSFRNVPMPLPGTVRLLGADYPAYRMLLIALSVAALGGLLLWYRRSRTALRIKAMVANPDLAQAVGIRASRLAAGAFAAGTCIAGLGGVMIAPLIPVQPFMGLDFVLRAFFALVIGGLGSLLGLFSGAAVIGGIDSLMSSLFDATWGYFTVLVVAILFLWRKPGGFFAR